MNKQELIKKYKELENGTFDIAAIVVCQSLLKDLKQLDEPEKVTIPQFVADWYEEHKDDFEFNIWDWVAYSDESEKLENKEFNSWINDSEGNPIQTLVNMHQFGYTVKEEKRYMIKLKGVPDEARFLKYGKIIQEWYFGAKEYSSDRQIRHTRKQLEEAGFGWVFDCPGIEIEEVE
ncbi:DUF1642 domain-containing protein [Streptococcus mitis]|uniref:DUF1642 domain-containing protein n=1 Tax=Streptococcus mitis TaxID=28037 RepID=UPI0011588B3B|nr:DUF1642 domain-containing protein [Streptococcus mitis]